MKDKKSIWPPVMVKYFRPALSIKGALTFLVLGLGASIFCVWIADRVSVL